jgi:hypothetical protein
MALTYFTSGRAEQLATEPFDVMPNLAAPGGI